MPSTDIVILAAIIFSFVAFAAVLAWADCQPRLNDCCGLLPRS